MKTEKLMFNDWVYNKNDKFKTPFQVKKIDKNTVMDENGCYSNLVDIRPIPLTPEILEKNGFINDKGIFVYEDETKVVTFFSKENNRPYCNYSFINIDCGCVTLNELPIEYVHELQHAFRLCGIEKEVEL